ncbi:MAG: DUF3299 domain-containing protein [Opitutus sp.]|nr:DUF3299 domain-containing protein [Opitutus sp.]
MKTSRWAVIGAFAGLGLWVVGATVGAEPARPVPPVEETGPAALRPLARDEPRLGFDALAYFPFDPPPFDPAAPPNASRSTGEEQIPAEIKRWSGRRVVITGYMVPVKVRQGLVTEFLLVRYTFAAGNVPTLTMNEWVIVRVKTGVLAQTRLPVSCSGVFKVGAVFEKGYLTAIYELEADRIGEG